VRLKEESSQMMFEFGKKNKGPANPMTKSYAGKTHFQIESSGESR
jgi:hypothetical protein